MTTPSDLDSPEAQTCCCSRKDGDFCLPDLVPLGLNLRIFHRGFAPYRTPQRVEGLPGPAAPADPLREHLLNGTARVPDGTKPVILDASRRVRAFVGQKAHLRCQVRNIRGHLLRVSWIREKDFQVLTSGMLTYTSDRRFHLQHFQNSDEWVLTIDSVKLEDAGDYQCQVGTQPKLSVTFYLEVLEVESRILGPPEIHVRPETKVEIVCVVNSSQRLNERIFSHWSFEDRVLELNSTRKQVYLSIHCNLTCETRSKLNIYHVIIGDSGKYSCVTVGGTPSSILIHVMEEFPAAVHQGDSAAATSVALFGDLILFLALTWRLCP